MSDEEKAIVRAALNLYEQDCWRRAHELPRTGTRASEREGLMRRSAIADRLEREFR